jgi:hypothetical protein
LRKPLGVIDILVTSHAAVDGLTEQNGQRKLRIFAAPRITQMLADEVAQTQPLIQLAHQDQTTIRGDP